MTVTNMWVGAVDASTATVVAHVEGSSVRVAVATDQAMTSPTYHGPVATSDGVARVTLSGLDADTDYWYQVEDDSVLDESLTGRFTTFPPSVQQVAFVAASTNVVNTTEITVPLPTGWQPGQLAILVVNVNDQAETLGEPSGWTVLDNGPVETGSQEAGVWWRVLQAGDSDPTVTITATQKAAGAIVTYTGFDPGSPIAAVGTAGTRESSSADVVAGSVTTTADDQTIIAVFAEKSSAATEVSIPAGMTLRAEQFGSGGGATSVVIAEEVVASAGATGTRTATFDVESGVGYGLLIAIGGVSADDTHASFAFAASSCAAGVSHPGVSPNVSNAPTFDTIRAASPLFFAHLGDLHYRNISVNDPDLYRDAYDDVLAEPRQHALYRQVPLVYVWDDHDYGPNNSDGTAAGKAAAQQVYRERVPHYPLPDGDGAIYQAFTVGRVLFIVSDTRSARSPNSATDDSSKTMLGAAQKAWMEDVLSTSTAEALVWLNPTPWMGLANDTWAGFTTEQQELVDMFHELGWSSRMICLNGDYHGLAMDSGGNSPGGFPVYILGSIDSLASGGGTPTHQYDLGPTSPGSDRYGIVQVADAGHFIRLTTTAYADGAVWGTHSLTVQVGAAPAEAMDILAYNDDLSRVRIDYAAAVVLNGNPSFEIDLDGWAAVGGTASAVRSTDHARDGVASALLQPQGDSGSPALDIQATAAGQVIAGEDYTVTAWVYSEEGWATVQAVILWRDSGGSLLTASLGSETEVPAQTWTQITVTDTAPANAVTGGPRVRMPGTPGVGDDLYIDQAIITPVEATVTVERSTDEITWETVRGGQDLPAADQVHPLDDYEFTANTVNHYRVRVYDGGTEIRTVTDSITPIITQPWLKSIARPFLNQRISTIAEVSDVARPARGGVFGVIGRSYPVAVTEVRGSRVYEIAVATETAEQAADMDLLLASGDTVFLQIPPELSCPAYTGYYAIGDTTETRQGVPWERRWFRLPLTEIAAPDPSVVGATINWRGVINDYATWQDLIDDQDTWDSTMELIGDPEDVVVQ